MNTFEITIQRKVGEAWPVVVEHSQSGQFLPRRTEGTFQLGAEQQTQLLTLHHDPLAYGTLLGQALDQRVSFSMYLPSAPEVNADPVTQQVQYSDSIVAVTLTATDVASGRAVRRRDWLERGRRRFHGRTARRSVACCRRLHRQRSHQHVRLDDVRVANLAVGTYTVRITVEDDELGQTNVDLTLTVSAEKAKVTFDGDNPVAVPVAEPGGNSGPFSLTVYAREVQPDEPVGRSRPGDISLAEVSMSLVPVGPGSPVDGACTPGPVDGSGYDAVQPVICSFEGAEVNAYSAQVTVDGGYYEGYGEDVLVVYDPSLGFATGGGWFYWPGTDDADAGYPGDRTNFGFTMKYNNKGEQVKGNLLLIRHLPDVSIYRVKSNALYGLALGEEPEVPMGWASFSGKSTYLEPGWDEPEGNYEFLVYVEDRNEPGTSVDRFWIEVKDKQRVVVPVMSMDREATDNAVELSGGNIAVPHGGIGKGADNGLSLSAEGVPGGQSGESKAIYLPIVIKD